MANYSKHIPLTRYVKMLQLLKERGLKGCIVEVGIGLEFSNSLLLCSGASDVILNVECPYAKTTDLSVSLKYVKKKAESAFWKTLNLCKYDPGNYFGLAISGAHYQDRNSHTWMYFANNNNRYWLHVEIPQNSNRLIIANKLKKVIEDFLYKILKIE